MKILPTITLLACGAVHAQDIGIKDFVLGGDLQAEAAKADMRCGPASVAGSAEQWCRPRNEKHELIRTIASVPTRAVYLAGFDNTLGSIYISFDQSQFGLVRDAFREKYPSMTCTDSVVKNRAGASFDQTECKHTTKDAGLTIARRGSDITLGHISVTTKAHDASMEADYKKRTGTAKKDI